MNDSIQTRPLPKAKRTETCFSDFSVTLRSAAFASVSQFCSSGVSHLASVGLSLR